MNNIQSYPPGLQLHGGLVPQALHIELHPHVGLSISLIAGVGHMLPATPPGCLAESLDGRSNRILNSWILNNTFQCVCVYIVWTLAGE